MTSLAQINGRNAINWDEKFRLDVWYVDNWSVWLDIRILSTTLLNVVLRKGINHTSTETMPFFEGSKVTKEATR
jgi:lipopolysaccharide/colanic/teichoic acid biosynthesis glycosyltransferase